MAMFPVRGLELRKKKGAREGGEEGDFTVKENGGQHPHFKVATFPSAGTTWASADPML